ncbi:uncharacterized protein AAEQ78_014823 [Lycaon pictus]
MDVQTRCFRDYAGDGSNESVKKGMYQQDREKEPRRLVECTLSSRRRYGVRTSLTAWKERMKRMILKEIEVESREERFRCSCHYCLYHRDLSEDTKHGEYL